MKTERIEVEHDKKINIEHLAIDAKDSLGIDIRVLRKPQTQTVVTDEGEVVDYLGYAFDVPAEAAADFAALIEQHAPEKDDAEIALERKQSEAVGVLKDTFRTALEDPEFIKLLKGALSNDGIKR